MSTDLADAVESLKRYVAVPGEFSTIFTETTDDDLVGSLQDAFAECQFDGFFLGGDPNNPSFSETDGVVTPTLTRGQVALILLYAAARIIQTQLLNLKNRQHYKAGTAEFETEQASNVLSALLKQYDGRKQEIIQRVRLLGASSAWSMADQYFVRAVAAPYGTTDLYYGDDIDRAYDYHDPFGGW